jgi:hypothetical protein
MSVSAVPVETAGMIRLNMILLFFVAVEPYLFNPLTKSNMVEPASTYYAVDIGGMNLVLAYFTHLLTVTKKNPLPPEEARWLGRSASRCETAATLLNGVSSH